MYTQWRAQVDANTIDRDFAVLPSIVWAVEDVSVFIPSIQSGARCSERGEKKGEDSKVMHAEYSKVKVVKCSGVLF